jgi:hypothetical protein
MQKKALITEKTAINTPTGCVSVRVQQLNAEIIY